MNRLIYTIALVVLGITFSSAQEQSRRRVEGREIRERVEGKRIAGAEVRRKGRKLAVRDRLTNEQRAERVASTYQKRLSLTVEQKRKVQTIELDRIKKSEEWRKQDDKAMRNKMKERRAFITKTREKIDKILTEEQRKTLASTREGVRERIREVSVKRPGRSAYRTPLPPPARN